MSQITQQHYADKATPNADELRGFFLGLSHALHKIEDKADCKTAREIINKERMELRLCKDTYHG